MNKKLLVIAPHADDAELGCGGYMHQCVRRGADVQMAIAAVADVEFAHLGRVVTAAERVEELNASAGLLKVSVGEIGFPGSDRRLDMVGQAALIAWVERVVSAFDPTEVLIPLPSSHQDHEAVYRACVAALRPSVGRGRVELVAAYEYPATSWGPGSAADAGKGGLYVVLDAQDLTMKMHALGCYKTQVRRHKHVWSVTAADTMARMRGLECGCDFAELFHVMREIRQ